MCIRFLYEQRLFYNIQIWRQKKSRQGSRLTMLWFSAHRESGKRDVWVHWECRMICTCDEACWLCFRVVEEAEQLSWSINSICLIAAGELWLHVLDCFLFFFTLFLFKDSSKDSHQAKVVQSFNTMFLVFYNQLCCPRKLLNSLTRVLRTKSAVCCKN